MAAAAHSRVYAVLGEFEHAGALLKAAAGVRDAGYKKFDAHSPFPIHGMDKAMGLGQSILGFFVFGGAITGCFLGYLMQWWMGAVDYPLNISGKPFFALEPSIPIMFELTILFSALAAVFGMFALNKLPRPYNPLFYSKRFTKVSDDGFFLSIEQSDRQFDAIQCEKLLRDLGAVHIEVVEDLEFEEL
ncbi:MAG TPA: DUF3341 domain-containing protein [Rhodothermales bacterium]|nr:DUF3341 domain-containing protein [Rhodothermales bacterium]